MLLNFVDSGMTTAEIAIALNRTYYGVSVMRDKLNHASIEEIIAAEDKPEPSKPIADVPVPSKPEACVLCFVVPTPSGHCNCFT